MPAQYRVSSPTVPAPEELKAKDLGLNLDIGGNTTLKELTPSQKLSKSYGGAYQEEESSGVKLETKLPIISDVVDFVGETPIGWAVGKTFEALNLPSYWVQNLWARARVELMNKGDLPQDVKDMIASGKSMDDIADYLVNSNRAFTNDAVQNLMFTLLLDPLNYTPLAFSKIGALKPLTAVAGGIAGGAIGGTAVAGPVGTLAGAALGAYGAYKGGRKAVKAAEAARAGVEAGEDLNAASKLVLALEKPRGLDITARVREGSTNLDEALKYKDEISVLEKKLDAARAANNVGEAQDITQKIEKAKSALGTLESARSHGLITNRMMVGIYRGITGTKNSVASGVKGFGAAMMVPANMILGLEYGGRNMNEAVDVTSRVFGDRSGEVAELIGEGLATPILTSISETLVGSQQSAAKMFASNTNELFWRAKASLQARAAEAGVDVDQTIDNISGEILSLAESMPGGAVKYLDTADPRAIRKRVEVLTRVPDIERSMSGRAGNAALGRLESVIAADYNMAKIESMYRAGGVEKALAELLVKMGPRKIAEKGAEKLRDIQTELIPVISRKAEAKELYRSYMHSIYAAIGDTGPGLTAEQRAQVDVAFETLFAKFYDKAGIISDERKGKQAAQIMSVIQSGSFTSANRAATRINESVRAMKRLANPVSDADKAKRQELVDLIGEDSLNSAISYAEKIGDIQLVKRGYLFNSSVNAATEIYSFMGRIADEASPTNGSTVPVNVRQELGLPLVDEYIGTEADVIALSKKIQDVRDAAKRVEDLPTIDFTGDLLKALRGRKTLAQARRAWADTALKHFDDVRSQFGPSSSPESINRMLGEAIANRSTLHSLTDLEMAKYTVISKLAGVDPIVFEKFKSLKYRAVRAPSRGAIRNSRVVQNPEALDVSRKLTTDVRVSPYIDLGNDMLKPYSKIERYNANRIQELMTYVFSPIGNSAVSNSVRRRLITHLARGGISTAQGQRIIDGLVTKSMEGGFGARGLQPDVIESVFREAFDSTGGVGAYERFKESWKAATLDGKTEFRSVDAVMRAFQGDLSVVGATQFATGAAKRKWPVLAGITDRMYPEFRFKKNPLYWVQEYMESPTLNQARGVDKDRITMLSERSGILTATAGEVRDLARVGPETQSIVDNINFVSVFREDAMKRALSGDWSTPADIGFKATMAKALRGDQGEALADVKEAAKDNLALDIASKQFSDVLMKDDPVLWSALVEHYGTRDSRELFINFVEHRKKLGSYDRVMSDIEASRPAAFGWMTIPDNRVNAKSAILAEELDRMFGSFTGLRSDTVSVWRANPQELVDSIGIARNNLGDAGYDLTMFDEEFHVLKQEARNLAEMKASRPLEYQKTVSNLESPEMVRLSDSIKSARQAMDRLLEAKMKATYRYEAARYLLLETGYRQGSGLSYEGERIAQALALGHSYGAELGDVATTLQKIVDRAAEGYPNVYKTVGGLRDKAGAVEDVMSPDELASVLEQQPRRFLSSKFYEDIRAATIQEIASNPALLDSIEDASYRLVTQHGAEEKVFRAFQASYSTALETANRVAYYNPNRSFFERTINHPFLGFYPYSYMFKKILPEMVQFLFKTPFGATAPGAGYQAYMHVRDYVEEQIETDYYFRKTLENNDQVMFMVSQLFPGVPWDITALPPAWARAVTKSTVGGGDKEYDPLTDFIGRDIVGKSTQYGPATVITNTLNASQQLLTELTGGNRPEKARPPKSGGLPDFNIGG